MHTPAFIRHGLTVAALLAAAMPALAAGRGMSEAQQRYQQERAMCMSGHSHQGRATCLREAGAAYAEAKRHRGDRGRDDYATNALQRCNVWKTPADRQACEWRVQRGTTSGSVHGGGIIRQVETAQ